MNEQSVLTILKLIADPTRYALLKLLLERNYCVSALARLLGISAPAVSQHLKQCEKVGLVSSKKSGYRSHYQVNRRMLQEIADSLTRLNNIRTLPCDHEGSRCSSQQRCLANNRTLH